MIPEAPRSPSIQVCCLPGSRPSLESGKPERTILGTEGLPFIPRVFDNSQYQVVFVRTVSIVRRSRLLEAASPTIHW